MELHTEADVTGLTGAGELTQQSRQDGAGQCLLAGQIQTCTVTQLYFPSSQNRLNILGNISNTLNQKLKIFISINIGTKYIKQGQKFSNGFIFAV